jgi:methanogenic corrinoid protein MtbC1
MSKTIDITPTWGEFGKIYVAMAESKEVKVIRGLRPEVAKAMAAAEALKVVQTTFTEEQHDLAASIIAKELKKQGY